MFHKADVLVIGGGIIGSAITYSLAKRGLEVIQVEQNEPASGASGANLGQISLVDRISPEHFVLAMESINIFRSLSQELGKDFGFINQGGFVLINSMEQLRYAKEVVSKQRQQGLKLDLLSVQETEKLLLGVAPAKNCGSIFCREEGVLDPLALTLAYQAKAKKIGAAIISGERVNGFVIERGQIICAKTLEKEYKAKFYVNAAGPWASEVGEMAGLTLPILYHKGTAMVTEPVPQVFSGPVVGGGILMREIFKGDEKRVGLAIAQQKNGSILIGQTSEKSVNYDVSLTQEGVCLTAKNVLNNFPMIGRLNIIRCWAGVTPYTNDGLPVFGFSGRVRNFLVAASFKGAFTTAPAIGEIAASLIHGRKSVLDLSSYSPDRFIR